MAEIEHKCRCGSKDFWQAKWGEYICSNCHPPIEASIRQVGDIRTVDNKVET